MSLSVRGLADGGQGADFLIDDIGGVAGNAPLAVTFGTSY